MDETSRIVEPPAPISNPKPTSPRKHLAELANLTAIASGAAVCAIRWRGRGGEGAIGAGSDSRLAAALDAIAARIDFDGASADHDSAVCLGAALGSISGKFRLDDARRRAAARTLERGGSRATVSAIIAEECEASEIGALLSLAAEGALGVLEADEERRSRDFWRRRAINAGARLARAKAEAARRERERRRIDEASAAAAKLTPRNRFAGLGAIFARLGPFDAWIFAALEDGELRAAAASAALAQIPPLNETSAIAESLRKGTAVHRLPGRARGEREEDRLFAGFASYVCIPLGAGAIGLASRGTPDRAAIARAEALGRRVEPIVREWHVRAEIERLRRLVRNLGFRMFGAIDAERARIARDLHDHQAQLLAAARIALEAGPDEARGIFKQVEDALRLRVRELRPAVLGRTTLEEALRYELRRLADAGIKGRLAGAKRMRLLTRPVQQLCYQVAREALSNVIRHSGASRAEVRIEKRDGRVFLTISDNGKGIDRAAVERRAAGAHQGVGLSGLGERLEMMGGKVEIESRAGATRVIAEIPEPC